MYKYKTLGVYLFQCHQFSSLHVDGGVHFPELTITWTHKVDLDKLTRWIHNDIPKHEMRITSHLHHPSLITLPWPYIPNYMTMPCMSNTFFWFLLQYCKMFPPFCQAITNLMSVFFFTYFTLPTQLIFSHISNLTFEPISPHLTHRSCPMLPHSTHLPHPSSSTSLMIEPVRCVWAIYRVRTPLNSWNSRLFKTFQGYLKNKFKTVLITHVLLSAVNKLTLKMALK